MSKWAKRVLSALLACVLVGGSVPLVASGAGYGSNGKFLAPINSPVAGSVAISTRAQLEAIKNNLNGKYHLSKDIDLSGAEWVPIGGDWGFNGVLDGQGFVIKNMRITGSHRSAGLFSSLNSSGLVQNLGMEGTNINIISNTNFTDVSAGSISGSVGAIRNCYNTGDVRATDNRTTTSSDGYKGSSVYVGGIVGLGGTLTDCYNTGDISSVNNNTSTYEVVYSSDCGNNYAIAGGISGSSAKVSNCYNSGKVQATSIPNTSNNNIAYAGGICGTIGSGTWGEGADWILSSYNTGAVTSRISNKGTIEIGGIVGWNTGSKIDKCYNTGNVFGESTGTGCEIKAGGICGSNYWSGSSISNCFNDALVSAKGYTLYIGGISGQNSTAEIFSCYNLGKIYPVDSTVVVFGGICGENYYAVIKDCYNLGEVTNGGFTTAPQNARAGGICASNLYEKASISNCYSTGTVFSFALYAYFDGICSRNDGTVTNTYCTFPSTVGTYLNDDKMKDKTSFVGFNFTVFWDINPTKNNGYPFLRGVPISIGDDEPKIPPPAILQNKPIFFSTETNNKVASVPIDFSDYQFINGASTYNHDLALVGSVLSASAYIKEQINEGLSTLEFKHIEQANYDPYGSRDQVAYSFGVKQVTCNGKRYNLFAVIIRGTVGKEWYSNINIGRVNSNMNTHDHSGFSEAFKNLYNKNTNANHGLKRAHDKRPNIW